MGMNRLSLSAAIISTLGVVATPGTTTAAIVPDGDYRLAINVTPTFTYNGQSYKDIGTDGAWNSTFTFGGLPSNSSQPMTDTDATVRGSDGNDRGSGIAGDGLAGDIGITVEGAAFTVSSFNVDTIFSTAGGDFAQFVSSPTVPAGNADAMVGTIDQVTGAMSFTPIGRLGAITAPNAFFDKDWNIDDVTFPGNTSWNKLTTATATSPVGTISGAPISALGDINGDTLPDFNVILVSGGKVGTTWGSFATAIYYETWNANLLSISPRALDDVDVVTEFSSKSIPVLDNDGGKPPVIIVSATDGALGTVVIDGGAASLTYQSTGGTGADNFTYTIQDGDNNIAVANVVVTVTSSPVIAIDDSGDTNQSQSVDVNVTANDSTTIVGESIDVTTISTSGVSANGGAVFDNNDGTLNYDPPSGLVGDDTFTYTVQDTAGNLSNDATVHVNVRPWGVTSAGVYGPGIFAQSVGSLDGRVTAQQIPVEDNEVELSCVGGCFDFIVSGATNPTQVVLLPLGEPLPAGGIYRKLVNAAWQDFDVASGDTIASADVSPLGGCPEPDDISWNVWGAASVPADEVGKQCLRLSISDNGPGPGPNDTDPAVGVIADPGGIGVPNAAEDNSAKKLLDDFDSSGCTVASAKYSVAMRADWLLLGLFAGVLGVLTRMKRN